MVDSPSQNLWQRGGVSLIQHKNKNKQKQTKTNKNKNSTQHSLIKSEKKDIMELHVRLSDSSIGARMNEYTVS